MDKMNGRPLTIDELALEHSAELPARDLMAGISLLGIPLLGLDGVNINIDTAGPNWLLGSIGAL